MTTNRDFDRIAKAWLAEGPSELADRVLDAALDEVHLTHQRRRLPVPWRSSTMNPWMRLAAAIAVVAIATYAGLTLLGPRLGPSAQATPTPSPAATPPCGQELAQGLVLTAGCTYRTSGMQPTLSILSDGNWLDRLQTPSALDFIAFTGPAQDTTVMVRPLRTVLSDPCSMGSGARRSTTPATARDYLAWLGGFIAEPTSAVPAEALGLQGWRFELGADVKQTFDPGDRCAFVSLSEPGADAPVESTETVGVQRTQPLRVYVLDANGSVLLVMLSLTGADGSAAGGEAFLAGIHAEP